MATPVSHSKAKVLHLYRHILRTGRTWEGPHEVCSISGSNSMRYSAYCWHNSSALSVRKEDLSFSQLEVSLMLPCATVQEKAYILQEARSRFHGNKGVTEDSLLSKLVGIHHRSFKYATSDQG